MSNAIEERILGMKFDNKQFESGIQTSLKSLGQLEKGLQLKGATNGLTELDRVAKSFSLDKLANSVDFIASKFTGLGIMGVTAMQNIANSVYHTAEGMVKSLTTEPIMAGFSEYETQINAVQTILANTQNAGKTLPDVTKALDELNAYADKTIYNFTEMTRNIGTFTAAGVDLDVATNSIQGIANLAAISGSNSQQASTAMYQLSQAMASGTVKLMDWNSVVNAGMGGQVFQDALKETAKVHGVAIDDMIKKRGSFRETLQDEWLTTEVLTETLEKFTATTEGLTEEQIKANREMWKARGYTEEQIDAIFKMGATATDAATKVKTFTQLFDTLKEAAQSGWTQSWETVVGDFEEAKELLTAISDEISGIINDSANARNTLLQGWKDAGGRDDLIAGFKNLYEAITALIAPAKEAFDEMFPAVTVQQLKDFTQKFEDVTKKFKIGSDAAKNLKRTFKGFFAIIDIGIQALSAIATGFADILGLSTPLAGNFLEMTASLGDFLVELSNAARESGIFKVAVDIIKDGAGYAAAGIEKLTSKCKDIFKFFENIDLSGIEVKIEPFKSLAEVGAWALEKLQAAYVKALPFLTTFGSYISDAFKAFTTAINGAVQGGGFKALLDLANGGLLAGLIVGVTKVAKAFASIGDNAGNFLESLSDIFEGVTDSLSAMQNKLNAEALKSLATAIAILAGSLAVLSMVDQDNLGASLAAVTTMFVELIGALTATTHLMSGAKVSKLATSIKAMKGMATAILILAASMAIMGKMDAESLMNGTLAVAALIAVMTIATKELSDGSIQMMKGAGSLIAFSTAIGILALSVKMLGGMDLESIGKGLLALGGMLAELAIFMKVYDVGSLGASAGIGLMAMASAMLVMSIALRIMGTMGLGEIAQGILALAGCMTVLCVALELLPDNTMALGAGLLAVSAALVVMGAALRIMGGMDFVTLATGLGAMALSLTILVTAANLMKGSIGGAAAILVMSAALVVLGGALKLIGSMSWQDSIQSILTLAAALAVIGVAATLLAPLTPAILALGAALIVFSIGVAAGGVALLALSAGLTALSVALTAFMASLVAVVTGIASLIPVIVEELGAAIIAIANTIIEATPLCEEAINTLVQAIVNVLANGIVTIVGAIDTAGPALLQLAGYLTALALTAALLAPLAPAIVTLSAALAAFGVGCGVIAAGVTLLAGALALLGASGLVVAASLTDIYASVNSMGDLSLDAVLNAAEVFRKAGKKAAKMILDGLDEGLKGSDAVMSDLIESLVDSADGFDKSFGKVGEYLANAFAVALQSALQNGVKTATDKMSTMMNSMIGSAITILSNSTGRFAASGALMMSSVGSGANARKSYTTGIIAGIGASMVGVLKNCGGEFYTIGQNIVQGLANGINSTRYVATQAATALGVATKNAMKASVDVNSPSKDFEDIGMWMDMGLANGLVKFAKLATNAAAYLGESTIQPVMTMTDNMLSDLGSMGSALRGTASLASALDSSITCEQYVTVNHTFEDLTVKGVNDRNEFVAVANYSVEEMMTNLMRKGIRR